MRLLSLFLLLKRKLISKRKFLLLYSTLRLERPLVDGWKRFQFDLSTYSERECKKLFRFLPHEIEHLRVLLHIPDLVQTGASDRVSGREALCILLRRLSYPARWIELRRCFGRSEAALSRIFLWTVNHIDTHFRWLVESWDQPWLTEEDFYIFESAIAVKGGVLRGCFGFVDGTARAISRPKRFQRECFSGHKRFHCAKWQAIVVPNGMICSLYGGQRGSMHDSLLLTKSSVVGALEEKLATFQHQHNFCLYGDSGYGRSARLKKPFSKAEVLADRRKKFLNKVMSRMRESVEWGFKDVVVKLFPFLDFKKQMRLFISPVNKMYRVAVILTNCHNCLHPNQTSQYFDLEPLDLEEYLQGQ